MLFDIARPCEENGGNCRLIARPGCSNCSALRIDTVNLETLPIPRLRTDQMSNASDSRPQSKESSTVSVL